MRFHLTGTFNSCDDCALKKKGGVNKKAVKHSKILKEKLFFKMSTPMTTSFGGKEHGLLVMEDSTDFAWGYLNRKVGVEKFDDIFN